MKTSQTGLTLIETSEGFRSLPYRDVAGFWTIGWGHLIIQGEDFSAGITHWQGQDLLQTDVAVAEVAVSKYAPEANQNQFDALVDFTFNLGAESLQMMLAHGWSQVPTQMLRWINAGGKPQTGLVRRRQAEVALFETPEEG